MGLLKHIQAKTPLARKLSAAHFLGSVFLLYLTYVRDGNLALGMLPLLMWGFLFNGNQKAIEDIYTDANEMIRNKVNGSIDHNAWSEFLARGMNGDARYIELQRVLSEVPKRFPPVGSDDLCSEEGKGFMLRVAELISSNGWRLDDLCRV